MVTDTKNKRGRPQTITGIIARQSIESAILDTGERAAINYHYATHFLYTCYGENLENGSFFLSNNRKVRRQGIAEQLGRMLEAELITAGEARELAQWAIDSYNAGDSVKSIADTLRRYRQNLAGAAKRQEARTDPGGE